MGTNEFTELAKEQVLKFFNSRFENHTDINTIIYDDVYVVSSSVYLEIKKQPYK